MEVPILTLGHKTITSKRPWGRYSFREWSGGVLCAQPDASLKFVHITAYYIYKYDETRLSISIPSRLYSGPKEKLKGWFSSEEILEKSRAFIQKVLDENINTLRTAK